MNTKLTTGEKLKDLRVERHLKLEELSKEVLIAASTLSNYENDENYDISAVNIAALADYYGVSVDYLLGRTDNRTETCTEIEELHLDDEVIEILKNGKINNRLLCDLVKDSDFLKLLADIEIYVDGIAQLQINNINSYVNVARKEIIDKYDPPKDDKGLAILEAVNIDEDHYFADRIHRDIDGIIVRMKDVHKNDKTSMQQSNAVQEIQNSLKAAKDYKGSADEKLVALFCNLFGVDHKKITREHSQALIEILKMSPKLKSGYSSRGKYSRKK
jgi:transcriptional regulator with XRE-family HTH domain